MDNRYVKNSQFSEFIQKVVEFNKVSHAYLIEVDDYEESFPIVLSFVKLILCSHNCKKIERLNCDKCNTCKLIDDNNYPDLKIIEPDGREIKKAQLLNLQAEYKNKSLLDNKRIYIIKEADKLNAASSNTILKFLEEPEDDIVAILLTTNRFKVLKTILSRCQLLSLKSSELFLIDDADLTLLKLIMSGKKLFINYSDIISSELSNKDVARVQLKRIQTILLMYLSYITCGREEVDCSKLSDILSGYSEKKIINFITIIEEEIGKLDFNVNYKLWLDCFFAKMIGGVLSD